MSKLGLWLNVTLNRVVICVFSVTSFTFFNIQVKNNRLIVDNACIIYLNSSCRVK